MPLSKYIQSEDEHGLWCLNCLHYISPESRKENHHIYPKAYRRTLEIFLTPDLPRTITLHEHCHTGLIGIQRAHDPLITNLRKIQGLDLTKAEYFIKSVEQYGLFEIVAALRWHCTNLASRGPEMASVYINNYAFAAGGDLSSSKQQLRIAYCRFYEINKSRKLTTQLRTQLLTIAGPLINAGMFREADTILKIVKNSEKRLPLQLQAVVLRREAMIKGDYRSALRSRYLSSLVKSMQWGTLTADELVFSSAIRPNTIGIAVDLEEELTLDKVFSLKESLADILADSSRLLRHHSLFHYANRILNLGVLAILKNASENIILSYLYRAQFLQIVFGLRYIPIWDPLSYKEMDHRKNVSPEDLINFVIKTKKIPAEKCYEIRLHTLGEDALVNSANLVTSLTNGAITKAKKNEIFKYEF